MRIQRTVPIAAVATALAPLVLALPNGLGLTPQMGYNSWYDLMCSPSMNETVLRSRAEFFVQSGLKDLGYNYVNLDDCYIAPGAAGRNANGTLVEDPATFPSGMKALADYVHGLGMKFGVYTDRGNLTCGGRQAALGYEAVDAETYAAWGIDYLKEDSCNNPAGGTDQQNAFEEYGRMRDALNATGRPIFFSLCGWFDWYAPKGQSLGNSWRIGPDDSNWPGIITNININAPLSQFAGPGGWNDPCLLLSYDWTGKAIVTELQSRAQFSMWAVMASPLLISGNPEAFSDFTLATYANSKVIAVNQDKLGIQGKRIQGGDLVPALAQAPHNADGPFPTVTVEDCVAGSDSQQWVLDSPHPGYISAKGSGHCLNSDNCQPDLIVYSDCPTEGCCNGCDNMIFRLDAKSSFIKAGANGTTCVGHIGEEDLSLGACDPSFAVPFTYNESTAQLQAANGKCFAQKAPADSSTNIWARPLEGGDFALVFLNVGSSSEDIVCDVDCFAAIGIKPGQSYDVEDLWNDVPKMAPITDATFTAREVVGLGGHLMIRLSPSKQ